jgi:hypothetical protein
MGAQTRQVGGGSATGVANNWSNFLNQQLMGSAPNQATQNLQGFQGQFGNDSFFGRNVNNLLQREINRQQSNAQQPQQQSSAFRDAFQGALQGGVRDISGAGGAIQNYFQNPTNQFTNQYVAPQFQGVDLANNRIPTNFGAGQTGMANLSSFGPAGQSNFNAMQQLGGVNSDFTSMLRNMVQGGANMQAQSGFGGGAGAGPAVNLAQGMSYQDAYGTVGQDPLMERERQRAAAEQRARFGAEGAGALGTGAQYAESNLNAELAARDASQRRQQAMLLMQQDLSERMGGAQTALGSRGQDLQGSIANMQGALQGAQNVNQFNLANQANLLGSLGQARGQDLSTGLGMRGQDLSQLGMGLEQNMFNTGQMNAMQQAQMQAALQNQGLGNQFGLGAAGLNNVAQQQNINNMMGMSGMQNQFNLNNAGQTAQFGNAAQTGNANFFQNMINQGMGMNQIGNQNTMNMLGQLFGGFGQQAGLGTAPAQLIQQPSPAGQLLNAGLTIGGAYFGGPTGAAVGQGLGSLFGGGGGFGGGGLGGGSLFSGANFGIGNPGGWGMTSMPQNNPFSGLDPRAIAADPQGFQRWLAARGARG